MGVSVGGKWGCNDYGALNEEGRVQWENREMMGEDMKFGFAVVDVSDEDEMVKFSSSERNSGRVAEK